MPDLGEPLHHHRDLIDNAADSILRNLLIEAAERGFTAIVDGNKIALYSPVAEVAGGFQFDELMIVLSWTGAIRTISLGNLFVTEDPGQAHEFISRHTALRAS